MENLRVPSLIAQNVFWGLLMRIENFPLMDNLAVSNMFLNQYSNIFPAYWPILLSFFYRNGDSGFITAEHLCICIFYIVIAR
jgi:hypothetical protein